LTYVDTSVLAAYYCPEPLSSRVQRILQGERERAISSLVEVELASALARKVRLRHLRASDARAIYETFQAHLEQGLYLRLTVDRSHFTRAQAWLATFRTPLRTLDALHVAVAAGERATLLTSDVALAAACDALKLAVRLIK
jgi:uncharacterized protein